MRGLPRGALEPARAPQSEVADGSYPLWSSTWRRDDLGVTAALLLDLLCVVLDLAP